MELYQLRTFVAVAEEGHLTRAAERLHTSQPSLSAHIKALEDELGVPLFVRTPKGMRLTHAGSVLKSKAHTALKTVDAIRFEAAQLKNELGGALRIGLNV
ncbi:MAG: LysR family transcriptional regulator, partial [Chloroflexota bacterium]